MTRQTSKVLQGGGGRRFGEGGGTRGPGLAQLEGCVQIGAGLVMADVRGDRLSLGV